MSDAPPILWQPTEAFIYNSRLKHYLDWLKEKKGLQFAGYPQAWAWSVEQPADFWESIWQYFNVVSHSPYHAVLSEDPMPDTRWFEGSTLNYAEHIFRSKNEEHPAIVFQSERHERMEVSWEELEGAVARLAAYLRSIGVKKGDRVVAFLPNIPEASVAFLATCSIGAIWSSCSPDFGVHSVIDRFQQIEPKVFFAVDGYQYNGKPYDKMGAVGELCVQLPTLEKTILLPYLDEQTGATRIPNGILWAEAMQTEPTRLSFEAVPFEHPIWVLYSSGTTGIPKAITHSHGGVLLEHFKYLAFHNDVHPGERFFWFSTTGWMMWNFVQASLLVGGTVVLYDGSPGYPNLNILWDFTEKAGIHHFGTSAPYLVACMKQGLQPGKDYDLSRLRSIGSTGAPLPPEAFDYVYRHIKEDVWLCSMSGGTDVCTAFVGGCPTEPVYLGEIQCRCLGCALYAFDDEAKPVVDEVGEMVITQPMPSMPIFFWNDEDKQRYLSSYFDMYPGIWRHGDWVKITPRHSLVILGRSDATLNRQGIRIGTAEIYRAVNKVSAVKDSLIVNLELSGGRHYMPLFVLMNEGEVLNEDIKNELKQILRSEYTPRHVPDEIIEVQDIPYTISGKKLEAPVKKILMGRPVEKAANRDSMRNPESLDFFVALARRIV
ncbi:MAG: acetoacetate--CoA ligase [Lewinellaceae bacterium]|nr:acetoacetate--CoA ligase [Phaeodactylibacter sp.]MCB9349035.1 acetoacetate--CoA ligase [Lewinellaceae bacterium]